MTFNSEEEYNKYLSEKDAEVEYKNKNKMVFYLVVFMSVIILVAVYLSVYFVYSSYLDTKVEDMNVGNMFIETDHLRIKDYVLLIDGESLSIEDLNGKDSIPTVVDISIIYEDDSKSLKQVYITYNTDENMTRAILEDGDYCQLILPKSYKGVE